MDKLLYTGPRGNRLFAKTNKKHNEITLYAKHPDGSRVSEKEAKQIVKETSKKLKGYFG